MMRRRRHRKILGESTRQQEQKTKASGAERNLAFMGGRKEQVGP